MPHPSTHPAIRRVAIVGAGTIGASWAALFLAHGLEVVVSDPAPDAEPLTRERCAPPGRCWPSWVAWPPAPIPTRCARARPGGRPEGRGLRAGKRAGTRGLQDRAIRAHGRRAAPHAIVASSSSGLIMSRLQSGCARPERFVIGHPFNPRT